MPHSADNIFDAELIPVTTFQSRHPNGFAYTVTLSVGHIRHSWKVVGTEHRGWTRKLLDVTPYAKCTLATEAAQELAKKHQDRFDRDTNALKG